MLSSIYEKIKILALYIAYWIAFGFGSGQLNYAPGTFATLLVGVPLYWFMHTIPNFYYIVILSVAIIVGIEVCSLAEATLNQPDDSSIVWDEICGYLLTMFNAPHGLVWILAGFLLFRLFDIWKIWPINYIDRTIKGGIGIMLDDIFAAIYAGLSLQLIAYLFQ